MLAMNPAQGLYSAHPVEPASTMRQSGVPVVEGPTERDLRIVVDLERDHGQALFGFVRRVGLTDQEAEDCVQETLLRLALQVSAGVAIEDPKAWAFRAIYRLGMDQHRLRRRVRLIAGRLRPPDPPDPATLSEREALWSEVDRLPLCQRQVLYLRYRADLSFDQVASTLGITSSAARSHATQAMARLRERLDPDAARERRL